ncbi:Ala-tRNA(Pro) hydrolase [Tepidamorphus gemmatus]|uniref:Ala-tRNA(Pro) hydrolase n=1 Tax=Tepidamorphus gemmatus TaxID=747076 RepID=A0A4R3MEC7_9HYPH|nr:prolyl-tRNA synthetase associated domain-containing protein [Tepidamorphus gemmatus]TCT11841.1 Ala-tRNA(Pro) hydrolase [Tepidamorphus gemmatus]
MPLSPDDLLARLEALGFETTTVRHPPLFTVAESQKLRGEIPGGHTKNLFMKDKKDRIWLVVAEEDADIDLKRLHERIGSARLSFARPELLVETLGVQPGSVTPFGVVNDTEGRVTVVLDADLLRHDLLNFHPLTNEATTTIRRDDLIAFLRACGHDPLVVDVRGPAADRARICTGSTGAPS